MGGSEIVTHYGPSIADRLGRNERRSASGGIYSTSWFPIVIDKEKLLRAVSVMMTAIGLTWQITAKIGDVAVSLDRRLDKLEQTTAELRAEVRLIDRAVQQPGPK